jgi:hypothetical protein
MAVIKKTAFPKDLDRFNVLVNDTAPNSRYFRITQLPDTFTGGKNAFLIAGTAELVPDTKIQIELKDSVGNIIYHEPGEGLISSSINNVGFVSEYFEGVSKVVAVYIYPETLYGPCTLTILGEVDKYEDGNGILTPVPIDWIGKYNVKWQKQINVNPSLANTTKIRFYQRPTATITEILSPIYRIESGSKVDSGTNQSFADIKLSKLETFAGDVKRVKVFRTSQGDISDYDLIQDILVESKELLTSYGLSGSVVGQTGILTSETLKNNWNTGSLNAFLTSSRVESGVRLTGSGYFTYTSSLDIKSANTYELNLDAFYSSSTSSNLGVYLSWVSQSYYGPITFSSSVATLVGTTPTKNLLDTVIPFKIPTDFPSASLYFSQSQGEWHLGNISLKLSQDTAFSPDEISFVTTMPTVIGNETYNFKFEFYDVNNNYVPVAVTQSLNFTGGTNTSNTAVLIAALSSSFSSSLSAVSTSISGTILINSSSVSSSILLLTGSISSSLSSSFGFTSSSIYTLSGSVSSSQSALSASISRSVYNSLTQSFTYVQNLANSNFSGSFISGNIIYAPVIGGQLGYFSTLFKVGQSPNSIYLDARQTPRKIFIGGAIPSAETEYSGAYNNTNTNVYLDSSGKFSLGNKLSYDGSNLSVNGSITITNPSTANNGGAVGSFSNGDAITGGSIGGVTIASNKIYIGTGTYGNTNTAFYVDNGGQFSLKDKLTWNGTTLSVKGVIQVTDGTEVTAATITGAASGATALQNSDTGKSLGLTGGSVGGVTIASTKIYVGTGTWGNSNTGFYVDSTGQMSLKDKLTWNGTTLSITGDINISGGDAATKITNAALSGSNAQTTADTKITGAQVNANVTSISGGAITTGTVAAGRIDVSGVITAGGITVNASAGISGGTVGGWSIDANSIRGNSPTGGGDGSYTTNAGIILSSAGWISSKNFYINSSGDAAFKGSITGASGTIGGVTIDASGITFAGGNGILTSSGLTLTGQVVIGGGGGISFGSSGYFSDIYNDSMFSPYIRLYGDATHTKALYGTGGNASIGITTDGSVGIDCGGYLFVGSMQQGGSPGTNYAVKRRTSSGELFMDSSTRKRKNIYGNWMEDGVLNAIKNVPVERFKFKNWPVDEVETFGLIAEDLHNNGFWQAVVYESDISGSAIYEEEKVDGIDYDKVTSILWKAVQELTTKIEKLETQISGSI